MKYKTMSLIMGVLLIVSLTGCRKKLPEGIISIEPIPDTRVEPEKAENKEDTALQVTQEFAFYSDDEHIILYNFPELYELDGQMYAISETDIDYETLGTRDVVQAAMDMQVEELDEIPATCQYKAASGHTYELANEQVYIKEQGRVTVPVTEEVVYENQHGKPSVPSKKEITYYDREAGADQKVTGLLKEFYESSPGQWKNTLQVEGTFLAPSEGVEEYELQGAENIKVPAAAEKPVWDGYGADILKSLKLDSKYYRITSAAWNGGTYPQDGYVARNAFFYGDELVSTYKAVYEAQREAQGYDTKVFYRMDALDADEEDVTTVYHIKAVVTYSLVEGGAS